MSNLVFSIDTIPTPKIDLKNALESDVAYYIKNGKFPPLGQSAMKKQEERLNDYLKYVNESFITDGFSSSNPEGATTLDTDVVSWMNDGQVTVGSTVYTTASMSVSPEHRANIHCLFSIVGNYTPEEVTTSTEVTDTDTQEVSTVTDTSYMYGTLSVEIWLDNKKKYTWKQKMVDGYNSVSNSIWFTHQSKGTHIVMIKVSCDHGSLVVAAGDHFAQAFGKIVYGNDKTNYLCFTFTDNAYFELDNYGMQEGEYPSLSYSTDKEEWVDFEVGERINTVANLHYYIRGNNSAFSVSDSKYLTFYFGYNNVYVSGSIMSLLSEDASALSIPDYAFYNLFSGVSFMRSVPDIPATSVGRYGCYHMFWGCQYITDPPYMNATTVSEKSFASMFFNCVNLKSAPLLPAETLAANCYESMFYGCSKLMEIELPATTLANNCYKGMFTACGLLASIKVGYTGSIKYSTASPPYDWPFTNWVNGVSSVGTFFYNGVDFARNVNCVPSHWTVSSF